MAEGRVAVLLSVGRHPVSGRARMAPLDASALELALRLDPSPLALHVGDPSEPALAFYLGMGLREITVIGPAGPYADAVGPLCGMLQAARPRLVLTGLIAERGEGSGMLPYLVADRLGAPIVAGIADVAVEGNEAAVLRAERGGRRRRLAVDLPAVLAVGPSGPKARQSAFARVRRGQIETVPLAVDDDAARLAWQVRPAKVLPKRIRPGAASQGPGAPLTGLSPQEAAERLYDFLKSRGAIE